MFKRNKFLILFIIVAIASFLRLWQLGSFPPGLYSDEAVNGINAIQALKIAPPDGGFKVFYPENFGREGLFINAQALSVAVFGNEAWALRIISSLLGILTVLGIYFLAKELFTTASSVYGKELDENNPSSREASEDTKWFITKIALLAAFFVATSFWHINFSRIGFRAISAPFWATWAFYFTFLAFRKMHELRIMNYELWNGEKSGNNNSLFLIRYSSLIPYALATIAGLFFGLGFHSYISFRVFPLIALFTLLYLGQKFGWEKTLKLAAVFAAAATIAFLPLGWYFLHNPADFFGRTSQVSVFHSPTMLKDLAGNVIKTAGMFNFFGDFNQRHNIAGQPELYWPVGIMFLLGVIGAKLRFKNIGNKSWRFVYYFLLIWLAVAALPVVISDEGIPHALRSILMVPAVFIFAAAGGIWLYEKIRVVISTQGDHIRVRIQKALLWFIFLMFLPSLALGTYTSYFNVWGPDPKTAEAFNKSTTDFAYELRALPRELKKYVIVPPGDMRVNIVQFLTDSYRPEDQKTKNIYYFQPDQVDENKALKEGIYVAHIK